jgi:hypothetical protein
VYKLHSLFVFLPRGKHLLLWKNKNLKEIINMKNIETCGFIALTIVGAIVIPIIVIKGLKIAANNIADKLTDREFEKESNEKKS